MNFDGMRSDGYGDTQIVDMLKQNPLFQGAVNVDGLKEKGFNDTQIVDSLKEDNSFKDEIKKRKEAMLTLKPQEEVTIPIAKEAPSAPTMPEKPKETSFLGSIKQAGENLLNSITGSAKEINRDVIKPVVSGIGNVIDNVVPFVKKEDLGIEKLPSETPSAYGLDTKEREISTIVESAKILSNSQLILPALFGDDEKNAKESFDKISTALMNTNIADKVEMDDKNQLYITKDGQEYKVEDGFFKTLPSMLDTYKNTMIGGAGGTIMGAAVATSKALPTPQLKAAAIAGGAIGSMVGSGIDMYQASDKTGLALDPQHFVNKLSEEGALSIVGDKLIDVASQGIKPLVKETKEFFTGDTRAYSQLKKDLQINDDYAEKALTNLNTVLEKPLDDTKQARMYAIALEHPQGLSLLEEALKRNQTASTVVENEIMKRTDSILKSMEENAIAPKEIMQFLEDSSDAVSKKYGAMREILRNDLANVPVQLDTDAISQIIKDISNSAHDPQVKSSFENFGNFVKSNTNYTENIDGLMELRQGVNRFFNGRNVKEWVAPDNAMLKKLIGGIDEAIYKTIDEVGDPQEATTLKAIFEDAKADFSAQKKAEASKFFKKIDADGLTSGQRAGRMVKGLEADDESAQYVLSRLSKEQREKLELTAINEVVQKELYGSSGGVKAIDYEDVIVKLKELSPGMQSENAKVTIDFMEKMENFFAKDRELIGAVKPIAQVGNNIATDAIGKMQMKTAGLLFEFAQRKIPFAQNSKRLDIYYRLGKYMEQSHNTKELMLKMYNDPLSDTVDKAFFGKAISHMSKGDDDAFGSLIDTKKPPESPSGGSSGILSEDELKEIESQVTKEKPTPKEVSLEDIKAKIAENVKAQYEPKQIELKKEDTFPDGSAFIDGKEVPLDDYLATVKVNSTPKELHVKLYDAEQSLQKLITNTNNASARQDLKQLGELTRILKSDEVYKSNAELKSLDEQLKDASLKFKEQRFNRNVDVQQLRENVVNIRNAYMAKEKEVLSSIALPEAKAYVQLHAKLSNTSNYKDKDFLLKLQKAENKVNALQEEVTKTYHSEGEKIATELADAKDTTFRGGYINEVGASFIAKTLSGAGLGSIPNYDYNGDGVVDYKDKAIGMVMGIVAFHSLTSKPAFAQYKDYAEFLVRKLEDKAQSGDMLAQTLTASQYLWVGAKASDVGAFSDVATRKMMKEIDDSKAKMLPIDQTKISHRLDEIIDHPELFKAYPELRELYVSKGASNYFAPQQNHIKLNKLKFAESELRTQYEVLDTVLTKQAEELDAIGKLTPEIEAAFEKQLSEFAQTIRDAEKNDDKAFVKDELLHEVQHAIQSKEKWAKGGNISEFTPENKSEIMQEIHEIETAILLKNPKNNIQDIEALSGKKVSDRAQSISKEWDEQELKDELERLNPFADPMKSYQKLWGEQQARATAYRSNMSAKERAKEGMFDTIKREEGSAPESIIKYRDGVMEARPLEERYIKNNMVDEKKLRSDADELPTSIKSYQEFKSNFIGSYESKGTYFVKTPIGDVKVDPKYAYGHFVDNTHFNDRGYISGAFVDTLKDPLFVVEKKYGDKINQVFYKPYKKGDDTYHLASFSINENGLMHKTFYELDNLGKVKGLIKSLDKDLKYFKHSNLEGSTEQLSPSKSAISEIIPQKTKTDVE